MGDFVDPPMARLCTFLLAVSVLSAVALPRTSVGGLTCPSYDDLATPAAAQLSTARYEGFWYEVYSHNVFLVDACQCTRYNFTMASATTFTDDFVCHKDSPTSDPPFVIHNKGSIDAKTPGKMVESLGPASPPYWVIGLWDANGSPVQQEQDDSASYAYALVYACVGSPLLGEYTYFFSRNDTIPAGLYSEMRDFATTRGISVASVKQVPMAGCKW